MRDCERKTVPCLDICIETGLAEAEGSSDTQRLSVLMLLSPY